VLVAGLAVAVAAFPGGCATAEPTPTVRESIGPPASAEQTTPVPSPSPLATPEQPLPVPEGETVLEVLDPDVARPSTSADEALALARAASKYYIGAAPRLQFVRLAFRDPYSDFGPEWTGWIIFATDVRWHGGSGPFAGPQPTPYATFTWIHVSADGEVMDVTQNGYENADQVPPVP
jgi:hypothetical protein